MAKVKVVKKQLKDKGIAEMFNQMLGAGSANIKICYPKYVDMGKCIESVVKVLTLLCENPYIKTHPDFELWRTQIRTFIGVANDEIRDVFSVVIPDYDWNLVNVPESLKKKFSECYEASKVSPTVQSMLHICSVLGAYRKHIDNDKALNYRFIAKINGTFCPFTFSDMNFKIIFDELTANPSKHENEIKLLLLILNKLFVLTYKLYTIFSRPDVDIDEFAEIIMSNIDEVKKRIPRCDKAFNKIKDSIDLLKGNFNEYFKDFVTTKDSTSIMQNFIVDVSKTTESDIETTRQFKDIIMYYNKVSRQHGKNTDPRVAALFAEARKKFDLLDKVKTKKQPVETDDTDDAEDEDDVAADDADDNDAVDADDNDADDSVNAADDSDDDDAAEDDDSANAEDDTADGTDGIDEIVATSTSANVTSTVTNVTTDKSKSEVKYDPNALGNLPVDEMMSRLGFQQNAPKSKNRSYKNRTG